ncbi:hypothetical protein NY486_07120, partial [Enterobacter hormaechei]|nr:hypothetical protein [Enterobacter hormaechei]
DRSSVNRVHLALGDPLSGAKQWATVGGWVCHVRYTPARHPPARHAVEPVRQSATLAGWLSLLDYRRDY